MIEILIGVWQPGELSGAAIQVDKAGPEDGQETHLSLPTLSCREKEPESTFSWNRLRLIKAKL